MAMAQLNEAKEHLSQSLKRRKDLAIQMNDHLYIEEGIEELHLASSLDEAIKQSKNYKKRMVHYKKK